ncbi:STAS domain-containing protein [Streptomyces sp. NPDC102487]|uniref:STAS domain-containing protein n=1 Tax=Streptomyces sp. NPDC102487 TaxID=3366182 RepID=UPI0037FD2BEB
MSTVSLSRRRVCWSSFVALQRAAPTRRGSLTFLERRRQAAPTLVDQPDRASRGGPGSCIDGDTAGLLGDALRVDTAGSRLVLDLVAVTFLDSSSIEVLFAAGQDAVSAGGWLRLAAMTPSVEEVIKIVDLDLPRVIACYPTVS